ncbi:MAG: ATP-dependent Clp protease ATP-binding subunit, partial [Clostridia bacterium]|nr:ATP-dependent Clp protease ATP-binding subunit [Clostridia bacterium]
MMMCTRCKKRPAVVFVSPSTDMNATQGYCLVCAKEIGIKPVNDIMEKMGITEEQLEAMTDSMTSLMNMEDGDFEPGGAVPFPAELLGQLGMNAHGDGMMQERPDSAQQPNGEDRKKKENFHKSKRKHIAAYCTDLTMKARRGELDAIIGRDREIERVVQILSRRTKNNPCLIGEPGVG